MFKGLGQLGSLLKNAHQISGRMQGVAESLKQKRVTASAGGGMVEIEINGAVEVLRCKIDETLLGEGADREFIEDLVVTAVNQAVVKAKQLHAEAVQEAAGGMELPGFQEAMAKFSGGQFGDASSELEDIIDKEDKDEEDGV